MQKLSDLAQNVCAELLMVEVQYTRKQMPHMTHTRTTRTTQTTQTTYTTHTTCTYRHDIHNRHSTRTHREWSQREREREREAVNSEREREREREKQKREKQRGATDWAASVGQNAGPSTAGARVSSLRRIGRSCRKVTQSLMIV